MFRVIVAEDDTEIRQLYAKVLIRGGYEIIEATDGQDVIDILDTKQVDLIISDVMMPRIDGYRLITTLRASGYTIPVLMITAKDSFEDLQQGFLSGADDYMVKPININEMVLRVQALLRRAQMVSDHKYIIGQTIFDYDSFAVIEDDKEYVLPQKEFLLLFKLISNCGKAFTRLQLMDEIWGYDTEADSHTVDVHINRLRNRFLYNQDFEIVTIRGLGYKVVKR